MSEMTERLKLPYIMPAQAMKHVSHNEALQRIDACLHLSIDLTSDIPVEIPSEGLTCLIGASPTGDWTGRSGDIAFWQDGAWQFMTPRDGWCAWIKPAGMMRVFDDGAWQELPLPSESEFDRLGIGATPDATNRFALSSDAALLNHGAGGGHQLKINKEATSHTASLLFQSAWTGHAEMGLAGNDAFSIKQSPDGSNWFSALTLSGNGVASFPTRPMVKATHSTASFSASSSSRSGFSTLPIAQGGFTLGAVVAGTMKDITVPASGNYLAILHLVVASAAAAFGAHIAVNGSQRGNTIEALASTSSQSHTLINLLQLNAGEALSVGHTGTSTVSFGSGKTELTLIHIG